MNEQLTNLEQLALRIRSCNGLSVETMRQVMLELIVEVAGIDKDAFERIESLESEVADVRNAVNDVDSRVDSLDGDVEWLRDEVSD